MVAKLTAATKFALSKGRSTSRARSPKEGRSVRSTPDVGRADSLHALVHHRIRLGIVSALAGIESLSFNELKALLKLTDGNLSVHARKLEDARYIECRKSFEERRPHTDYRLTSEGRAALQRYLNHMEALIKATRVTLER
jgi:DNA-binding HxlR family transcriptional regulator